jgi:hypothetical protein
VEIPAQPSHQCQVRTLSSSPTLDCPYLTSTPSTWAVTTGELSRPTAACFCLSYLPIYLPTYLLLAYVTAGQQQPIRPLRGPANPHNKLCCCMHISHSYSQPSNKLTLPPGPGLPSARRRHGRSLSPHTLASSRHSHILLLSSGAPSSPSSTTLLGAPPPNTIMARATPQLRNTGERPAAPSSQRSPAAPSG